MDQIEQKKLNSAVLILVSTVLCLIIWLAYDLLFQRKSLGIDPKIETLVTPLDPNLDISLEN
jgi:hypothetical protein